MTDISFPRGLPLIAPSRGSGTRKPDKEEVDYCFILYYGVYDCSWFVYVQDAIFGVKRARRIEPADAKGSKKAKSQS